MLSPNRDKKKAFLTVTIIVNYIFAAAVTYLVYATGGAPSVFANLVLLPIIVTALYTPVWHSVLFSVLSALAIGPLTTWINHGDMNDYTWIIRLLIYVVMSIVVSSISSQSRKRERYYENLATHDELTGLLNFNCIPKETIPSNGVLSILRLSFTGSGDMLGLFGSDFYQDIIRHTSEELEKLLQPYPNATLYKGNELEYAIIVKHFSSEESLENLLAALDNLNGVTMLIRQIPVYLAFRIGFTVLQPDDDIAKGLRNANIALRYSFLEEQQISRYTEAMRDYYKGTVSIASEFSSALEKGSVQASYQTIHNARTGEAESVEILAKWIREDGSKMTAEQFVPILEKTSCLHDLTMFMTKEALQYAISPLNEGHGFSINFSAIELTERSVMEFVRTIEGSGFDPQLVMVEITGRFAEDEYTVRNNLQFLHKHGIRIAIDYTSAAFSSFAVLTEMPLDVIKLSRKITSHVENERGYLLFKSIVDFAHENEIKVVAEGIENESQARLCTEAGADYLQGYHFSVPRLLKAAQADMQQREEIEKSQLSSRVKPDPDDPYNGITVVRKNDSSSEEEKTDPEADQ